MLPPCGKFRAEENEMATRLGAEVLGHLSLGVILVDAHGRVLHANAAAEEIARERGDLLVREEGLRARSAAENEALSTLLRVAIAAGSARAAEPRHATLAIGAGPQRSPLRVTVTPLACGPAEPGDASLPAAIVFVTDPDRKPPCVPEVLRVVFGLTAMQARLALLLAEGVGVAEAARQLAITVATARKYLREAFRRTRTRRQAALVAVVLGAIGPLRGPAT
jgi:DNA-binding CsgD family transcriptional regulator